MSDPETEEGPDPNDLRRHAKRPFYGKYFTGEQCVNGHVAERFVSNRSCVICVADRRRQRYRNDPIGGAARVRNARQRDLEKAREYGRKRYAENKGHRRNLQVKFLYGLSADAFAALKEAHNHSCAICLKPEITVDHDHVTGKIRGILCGNCNRALGLFCDSPKNLRAAAAYLEQQND